MTQQAAPCALGSPISFNTLTTVACLPCIAKSNAVLLSTSRALTSAILSPFSRNILMSSARPPSAAPCKGVILEEVSAMRLAPFSTSNSAASICPLMLAQCKAVRPLLSGYCGSNMGGRNGRSLRGDAPEGKDGKKEKPREM